MVVYFFFGFDPSHAGPMQRWWGMKGRTLAVWERRPSGSWRYTMCEVGREEPETRAPGRELERGAMESFGRLDTLVCAKA